ncbi:MAG: DUF3168 domain-containing protein [Bacteroidota bacterium]
MEDHVPHEAIYQLLTAPTVPVGLSALVGDRIYPVGVEEDVQAPYITYSQVNEDFTSTKDGLVSNGYVFEVAIYGNRPSECVRGAKNIRKALNLKTHEVPDLGTLRLKVFDQADEPYDDEADLFSTVVQFRARKIS